VKDVQRYADAVVIGSAIVSEIERSPAATAERIGQFVKQLNA